MEGRTDPNTEPIIHTVYDYLLAKDALASAMRGDWPAEPSDA
jgi:hypothetical protein